MDFSLLLHTSHAYHEEHVLILRTAYCMYSPLQFNERYKPLHYYLHIHKQNKHINYIFSFPLMLSLLYFVMKLSSNYLLLASFENFFFPFKYEHNIPKLHKYHFSWLD